MGKAGREVSRRAQAARQNPEHGRLRSGVAQPAPGVFPAREPETAPAERAACAPCARRNHLPQRRECRGKLACAILRHALSRRRGDGGVAEAARLRRHRRSEEHTSELQSPYELVCRLLLEKKKTIISSMHYRYIT